MHWRTNGRTLKIRLIMVMLNTHTGGPRRFRISPHPQAHSHAHVYVCARGWRNVRASACMAVWSRTRGQTCRRPRHTGSCTAPPALCQGRPRQRATQQTTTIRTHITHPRLQLRPILPSGAGAKGEAYHGEGPRATLGGGLAEGDQVAQDEQGEVVVESVDARQQA
jgi:hypothetical protein